MKYRRSEPREIGLVFRLGTQKKLEGWDANPKTVRSGVLREAMELNILKACFEPPSAIFPHSNPPEIRS